MSWMWLTGLALASGDGGEGASDPCWGGPLPFVSTVPVNVEAGKPVHVSAGVSKGYSHECFHDWGYTIGFGDGTRTSGTGSGCGPTLYPAHVYTTPGTYNVTFTVRYGCMTLTDTILKTWGGSRSASGVVIVREPGTAAPAAPNTSDDWADRRGSTCSANPMWGLDYALVGGVILTGLHARKTGRRRA